MQSKRWIIRLENQTSSGYNENGVKRMLYEGNNPVLRVENVEFLTSNPGTFAVAPRAYSSLSFRIRGTARMETEDSCCTVNTNDILYMPQGLAYTAHYTETEMITFHFVTEHRDAGMQAFSFENGEKIYKTFLQAEELWRARAPGYRLYAMSALYTVLGMICQKETHAQLPPHFLRAVSVLNSCYTDSRLNLGEVCAEAGIAQSRFRQLFKLHYGKTPVDYLTELRIEHARSCISGGMSVEAAAEESGFNDPKYFARTVKKRFGCTPKSFKTYGK